MMTSKEKPSTSTLRDAKTKIFAGFGGGFGVNLKKNKKLPYRGNQIGASHVFVSERINGCVWGWLRLCITSHGSSFERAMIHHGSKAPRQTSHGSF